MATLQDCASFFMSGLLDTAHEGALAKVQRLVREGVGVHEVIIGNTPVVQWLLKTGGARISDVNCRGSTALTLAANRGRRALVQWLLEEGGANITDGTFCGESESVWDKLSKNIVGIVDGQELAALTSLLKVMVLLGNAPPDFIDMLVPHNAAIAILGRKICEVRPAYLGQQHALIQTTCPLPAFLKSIVTTYAEPTPEDMWTDWAQWM
jgi:hypothetical protein